MDDNRVGAMSSIDEATEHNDSELLEGKESSNSPRNVANKTTAIREIYKKTSANVIGFIKHEDDPFWTERKGEPVVQTRAQFGTVAMIT